MDDNAYIQQAYANLPPHRPITGHTAQLLADVLNTCVQFDNRDYGSNRYQTYMSATNPHDAATLGAFSYENGNIVVFPDMPLYAKWRQAETIKLWRNLAISGSRVHAQLIHILED